MGRSTLATAAPWPRPHPPSPGLAPGRKEGRRFAPATRPRAARVRRGACGGGAGPAEFTVLGSLALLWGHCLDVISDIAGRICRMSDPKVGRVTPKPGKPNWRKVSSATAGRGPARHPATRAPPPSPSSWLPRGGAEPPQPGTDRRAPRRRRRFSGSNRASITRPLEGGSAARRDPHPRVLRRLSRRTSRSRSARRSAAARRSSRR